MKTCACGRVHDASAWQALPFVGVMFADDPELALELRNCPCKSTIAIRVSEVVVASWFSKASEMLAEVT